MDIPVLSREIFILNRNKIPEISEYFGEEGDRKISIFKNWLIVT